ncbi:MAG TPA: gliding motility-associated ABC transporter substrate-binding protein GldG, partial [Flavobacteriales bacterium]|nr:gliding motility-associated ABC transporter substrate-binding protein GldG [Flavobacteriales bacterium]
MVVKSSLFRKSVFSLLTGVIFIVLLNIIGRYKFERFDLTSEKRYTLSEASMNLAEGLDDIVYVKVYLEGEFPAGFQRLRNSTKEMLDEFRAYSNNNIEYEFINPSESSEDKIRNKLYDELMKQGLQPTSLQLKEEGGSAQKIIFPGAIFTYKERQLPLQLLKNRMGAHPEEMLNNSVQGLEYEISNVIRKLK